MLGGALGAAEGWLRLLGGGRAVSAGEPAPLTVIIGAIAEEGRAGRSRERRAQRANRSRSGVVEAVVEGVVVAAAAAAAAAVVLEVVGVVRVQQT